MRRNRTDYAINRYYSPDTGRFTTHDPLTELDRPERLNQPQGLNLYPYVMGGPTRYTDSDGRDWTWNPSNGDFEWRADKNQSPTKGYVPVKMGQSFDEMWDWTGEYASLNGLGATCINPDVHSPAAFDRKLPPPPPDPLEDDGNAEPTVFLEGATIAIDQPEVDVNEEFVQALPGAIASSTADTVDAIFSYPERFATSIKNIPTALIAGYDSQVAAFEDDQRKIASGDYAGFAKQSFARGWDATTMATGLPSSTTLSDPSTLVEQAKNPEFFIDKTYEVGIAIGGGALAGRAGRIAGAADEFAGVADDAAGLVDEVAFAASDTAVGSAPVVEQYALRAVDSGFYPVYTRGSKLPTGLTWLEKGDVWKFGTTKNPATRYSATFLRNTGAGLRYSTEWQGTLAEALQLERMKIQNFKFRFGGELPAGNKIVR